MSRNPSLALKGTHLFDRVGKLPKVADNSFSISKTAPYEAPHLKNLFRQRQPFEMLGQDKALGYLLVEYPIMWLTECWPSAHHRDREVRAFMLTPEGSGP
jgi:hypothetical protein